MSPLVQECQRTLIDISTRHSVGLFWVPELSRVRGSDIADELAREETVHQFVLPEPALGVSRQNIRKKRYKAVWATSIWPCAGVLSVLRDTSEN